MHAELKLNRHAELKLKLVHARRELKLVHARRELDLVACTT